MPQCTVRYAVRLVSPLTHPMSAVGIYSEERQPDERGEPGDLVSRTLAGFGGPAGEKLMALVRGSDDWRVEIESLASPLEWDDGGNLRNAH